MRLAQVPLGVVFLIGIVLFGRAAEPNHAHAAAGITVVAQIGGSTPVGGTYSAFGEVSLNDLGDVAFLAFVNGGPTPKAIFLYKNGQVSLVAGQGYSIAPSGSTYSSVGSHGPRLNNAGQVAFIGTADNKQGVYRAETNGTFTKIAEKGENAPIKGTYEGVFGAGGVGTAAGGLDPDFDMAADSDTVAFEDAIRVGSCGFCTGGVFTSAGARVAALGDSALGGQLQVIHGADLNDAGDTGYLAWTLSALTSGGLFVNGASRVLVGQPSPGGGSTYSSICCDFRINDFDQWAIKATLSNGRQGIFVGEGSTSEQAVLVDDQTALGGDYDGFESFDLNDSGDLVFNSNISAGPGRAVFYLPSDSTVAIPVLLAGEGGSQARGKLHLNNSGQIAFNDDAVGKVLLARIPTADFKQGGQSWSGHLLGGQSGCTLAKFGCAVTAVADVLASYGTAQLTEGYGSVNPGNLNSWLRDHGGFDGCSIKWGAADNSSGGYAGEPLILRPHRSLAEREQAINNALGQGELPIVRVQNQWGPHWVVLSGVAGNSYTFLDPDGASGGRLSDIYGVYYDVVIYRRATSSTKSLSVRGHSPIELVITDPQGNKTGYDSATNSIIEEIPGSSYGIEAGIADDDGVLSPLPDHLDFELAAPVPGTYSIEVAGVGTGPYEVVVSTVSESGYSTDQTFSGTASSGSHDEYQVQISGSAVGGIAELPGLDPNPARTTSKQSDASKWRWVVVVTLSATLLSATVLLISKRRTN